MGGKDAENLHGRCLCGGVGYAVSASTSGFSHCHCPSCRRASGAAYGVLWGDDPWALQRYLGDAEHRVRAVRRALVVAEEVRAALP